MTPTTYEQRLDENPDWALREGSMHFENESAVHKTLREIARRLDELGVAYAVAGGMALYFQGDLRFTEDVDILVTREGIARIHDELEGRRYLPPFTGSRNLRDTDTGVRIKFRVAGDYPGDGKPKPVAFPDPTGVAHEIDGIRFLDLQRLVELKLASGMTHPRRKRDLVDVEELIDALKLSREFADELNPFVRDKYLELWQTVKDYPDPE